MADEWKKKGKRSKQGNPLNDERMKAKKRKTTKENSINK